MPEIICGSHIGTWLPRSIPLCVCKALSNSSLVSSANIIPAGFERRYKALLTSTVLQGALELSSLRQTRTTRLTKRKHRFELISPHCTSRPIELKLRR
eukprot:11962-Heterococcus_DN1.PRE.1